MDPTADRLRTGYAELISVLKASGRVAEAQQCAEMAVRHGLWSHPAQRPLSYVPSLPAIPVYDAKRFWITGYLEQHWREIRSELDSVTDGRASGFTPVEEPLLDGGSWDEVIFYEGGHRFVRAHSQFPVTSAVLEAIPEEVRSAGVVMFSWLGPHSHILPHCGHTNARLRVHLGLRVPSEQRLRVHKHILTWIEGRCLVFDDSFEHEVWNTGDEPRVVMLFDVFHPALPEAAKRELTSESRISLEQKASQFMKERGVRRIWRNTNDGISVELDQSTELLLSRYLREAGIEEIEWHENQLQVRAE